MFIYLWGQEIRSVFVHFIADCVYLYGQEIRSVFAHFTADCVFTCVEKRLRGIFPHFIAVFYLCGKVAEECISTLHRCILPVRKRG